MRPERGELRRPHLGSARRQRRHGATASIAIPWFVDRYEVGADWRSLAWWIHDHLPYSSLFFFPKLAAFNIKWHENSERRIDSHIAPKGCLTRPGHDNHEGDHSAWCEGFPKLL